MNLLLDNLRSEIIPYFSSSQEDYSHCLEHTNRVVEIAKYLCQHEGGDSLVVILAALLHDVARSMEDKNKCVDHAEKGAQLARDILTKYTIPVDIINQVVYCIQNHRSDKQGVTLEAKILRDADKLDSLGAVSITRVIASSFQSSQYYRPVFDPSVPLDGQEKVSAIHYLILLIQRYKNGDYFYTKTARDMAEEKASFMEKFVKKFTEEWFFNQK